jgi:hypothetical protein
MVAAIAQMDEYETRLVHSWGCMNCEVFWRFASGAVTDQKDYGTVFAAFRVRFSGAGSLPPFPHVRTVHSSVSAGSLLPSA